MAALYTIIQKVVTFSFIPMGSLERFLERLQPCREKLLVGAAQSLIYMEGWMLLTEVY